MAIEVKHLTKAYGKQIAVNDISFVLNAGEVIGFLGPNGAGKSTTLKLITGYLQPDSGSISVNGYSVRTSPVQVRASLGYLPEHNPLYLDQYVRESLSFVAELYGQKVKQVAQTVARVIEQTGLGPESHKRIGALSKGYRQRVGIAQALVNDPPVLILDEPTSGLDPNQVVEIRNLIRELGRSKTVIFSSHILQEVEAIAQRVLIIHKGSLLKDAPLTEVQANAGSQVRFVVEFENAGFELARIAEYPGVISVTETEPNKILVTANADTDVRKLIYDQSIQQQNPILALTKLTDDLEAIFRRLTQSTASDN